MPLILELVLVFLRIGLFGFGGGFAILPFIQTEMVSRGWLSLEEFSSIAAIAQMTPGPLGINTATYVGYKVSGLLGSTAATLSIVALPFVISLLVGRFYVKYSENKTAQKILLGIRPVTIALILIAGISFLTLTLFDGKAALANLNYTALILFILALAISLRFK
ncbi:MAG TPA: chromate transporter, partial [Clostridia bacterium]|nr:chromate transporter [Clostridia bacterium]